MFRMTTLAVFTVAAGLLATGCYSQGAQAYMEGTRNQPAAVAQVSYKRDQNRNTDVTLRIEHLSPPERMNPSLNTYVVWVAPVQGGTFERQGALMVDQNRTGSISFLTPLERFKLLITAETSPLVAQPRGEPVMQGTFDASR